MMLSAIRRLISRAVVRVAILKFVVLILRMDNRHIVRRANNMPTENGLSRVFLRNAGNDSIRIGDAGSNRSRSPGLNDELISRNGKGKFWFWNVHEISFSPSLQR